MRQKKKEWLRKLENLDTTCHLSTDGKQKLVMLYHAMQSDESAPSLAFVFGYKSSRAVREFVDFDGES